MLGSLIRVILIPLRVINRAIANSIRLFIELFYIAPLTKYISREVFRYIACGVGNYIILDALLYYIVYHYIISGEYIFVGITTISPHISSLMIVFPITFLTGFWLNRYVAFISTARAIRAQIARYAISICGSILLSYITLKFLVEVCGIWATPAKITSSLITSIYSYLMARLYTFKR